MIASIVNGTIFISCVKNVQSSGFSLQIGGFNYDMTLSFVQLRLAIMLLCPE